MPPEQRESAASAPPQPAAPSAAATAGATLGLYAIRLVALALGLALAFVAEDSAPASLGDALTAAADLATTLLLVWVLGRFARRDEAAPGRALLDGARRTMLAVLGAIALAMLVDEATPRYDAGPAWEWLRLALVLVHRGGDLLALALVALAASRIGNGLDGKPRLVRAILAVVALAFADGVLAWQQALEPLAQQWLLAVSAAALIAAGAIVALLGGLRRDLRARASATATAAASAEEDRRAALGLRRYGRAMLAKLVLTGVAAVAAFAVAATAYGEEESRRSLVLGLCVAAASLATSAWAIAGLQRWATRVDGTAGRALGIAALTALAAALAADLDGAFALLDETLHTTSSGARLSADSGLGLLLVPVGALLLAASLRRHTRARGQARAAGRARLAWWLILSWTVAAALLFLATLAVRDSASFALLLLVVGALAGIAVAILFLLAIRAAVAAALSTEKVSAATTPG